MTTTQTVPSALEDLKVKQRTIWSSGDYGRIAWITVPLARELADAVELRPGATVLDVGISHTELGPVGDVEPEVAEVAGFLAPVPGGVGPLTRGMLLTAVVEAAERAVGLVPAGAAA